MRYIADLHIHSKYSRACSKDLDLEHNAAWAKKKGIQIVGTGDFTHPVWFKELEQKLVENKPGLFTLGTHDSDVYFMLTTEISCIYKQGDKVRRIHLCLFAPSFDAVKKIITALEKRKVNLKSDGRPIMGLRSEEIVKIVLDADDRCMVIPAHAWTPWFSVFGSKSGFDSIEECFGNTAKYIYAIETGLSSDPPMNWRWSYLDKYTLISNSDAHSPANLGREANAFEIEENDLSYNEISRIIKTGDKEKFLFTIEFFPEEGKYHQDGHRLCKTSLTPLQTKKHQGLCPVCKKKLTIGVLNRVVSLSDRNEVSIQGRIPYISIVPLEEIIAEVLGQNKKTKRVREMYELLVKSAGSEFSLLLDLSLESISTFSLPEVVTAIQNIRQGKVSAIAGYDGEYGVVKALGHLQNIKQRQQPLF